MSRNISVYLETLRVIATLMVFVSHSALFYEPLAAVSSGSDFGRDGVIIFFVLSGFVISWCADQKDGNIYQYGVSRAARIYSVAIPAIILGFLSDVVINADSPSGLSYQLEKLWIYIPIHLTFTGYTWTLFEMPPFNFPYWSLCLEVWFYVLLALVVFVRSQVKYWLIGLILLALGPRIWMFLPIWAAGALIYFNRKSIKLNKVVARLLFFGSIFGYFLVKFYGVDQKFDVFCFDFIDQVGLEDAPIPKRIFGNYLLSLLVVANFIAAINAEPTFPKSFSKLICIMASFSFSFYLFHVPIYSIMHHYYQNTDNSLVGYFMAIGSAATLIVILALITEYRKGEWRLLIGRALPLSWAKQLKRPMPGREQR